MADVGRHRLDTAAGGALLDHVGGPPGDPSQHGAARDTIAAIRAVDRAAPIVVGGQAVLNPEIARLLDADAWAADGRSAVRVIDELARAPRAGRSPRRPAARLAAGDPSRSLD